MDNSCGILRQYYNKGSEKHEQSILLKCPSANTLHVLLGELYFR